MPGVTRDRIGAGRAAVPAPLGADGRAAQHRARHAEQDPRSDGDAVFRSSPAALPPAASTPSTASTFWSPIDARGIRRGRPARPRDRPSAQRLARAGRARMLSHHAWDRSMQRLDGIIERCLAESGRGRREQARATARSAGYEHQHLRPRLRRRGVARLPRARWPPRHRRRHRPGQARPDRRRQDAGRRGGHGGADGDCRGERPRLGHRDTRAGGAATARSR